MTYRQIENFVQGKLNQPEKCEDILFTSSDYVAVIDGSSIKSRHFGDKTSGRYIAELIAEALKDLPPNLTMEAATLIINKYIRQKLGYPDSAAVMTAGPRPAASVAILSLSKMEVWAYGDTLLTVDGIPHDLTKEIDNVTTLARCAYVRGRLLAGDTVDQLIRSTADLDLIQPLLQLQQAQFLNNKKAAHLAYANIDGADEVIDLVKIISVASAKEIIMGSDGYPYLEPTLIKTEEELARALRLDPLMIDLYPQVKGLRLPNDAPMGTPLPTRYDDCCYVRLAMG